MQIKSIIAVGLSVVSLVLQGCASDSSPESRYKNETEAQIFHAAVKDLKKSNFSDATKRFETQDARYPFGDYAERAQLFSIYAYYEASDNASALAAADRYIHLYPASPAVGYALYMHGLVNYEEHMNLFDRYFPTDVAQRDMSAAKASFIDFTRLTREHAQSIYVPGAYQYMAYLRNMLALHQLKVAQFYFDRKLYVGAVNRASEVLLHYQGAPSVKPALQILILSYQRLELASLFNDALRVYLVNFGQDDFVRAKHLRLQAIALLKRPLIVHRLKKTVLLRKPKGVLLKSAVNY